ncbi:UNVERIFIED_CONTAM: hypothetical protein FKN15_077148 [Acipenser sinensis]
MDPTEREGTRQGELSPQLGAPVGSREWAMAWLKSTPIIKALWRGKEKAQWIEQNLRWREKEQEEEVYEEEQSGEIDSTMLPDSQTGSKRDGQPGSRAPPRANVTLELGIPLLSTPQRFTIMGERNLPRQPIKSDLENSSRRELQTTATREARLLMENRGLTASADAE